MGLEDPVSILGFKGEVGPEGTKPMFLVNKANTRETGSSCTSIILTYSYFNLDKKTKITFINSHCVSISFFSLRVV